MQPTVVDARLQNTIHGSLDVNKINVISSVVRARGDAKRVGAVAADTRPCSLASWHIQTSRRELRYT